MALLLTASRRLLCLGLLSTFPLVGLTQTFSPQGGEYPFGALPGDQDFPSVSLNASGGYIVWEDNRIDGNGLGIGALRLDSNFSPLFSAFRINQKTAGDQQKPQVAVLNKGGAAIVWQAGGQRSANINARFLNAGGTFTGTNDIRVNSTTNTDQVTPVLTVMTNGNVFVVWSSWSYSTTNQWMQDIRAQILTTNGTLVGTNFYVNGADASAPSELYNQRNPVVATLANGNIVVAWVSENPGGPGLVQGTNSNWIHIYARLYSPSGVALGAQFRVNSSFYSLCANPAVCGTGDGGFTVAWSQMATVRTPEGWDVYGRSFSTNGTAVADAIRINSWTKGDQFGPRMSRIGSSQLVVWTSIGQEAVPAGLRSAEGVFGQLLSNGALFGSEFQVNTTTISRQMHPAVASDASGRFLVTWSSFVANTSFDLYAQRYAAGQALPQPAAPFVSVAGQSMFNLAWPALSGFPLSYYEIYQDGGTTPSGTTASNMWMASGFAPGSTHWFQLAFVLAGGQRSPLSAPTTNKTWGVDAAGQFGNIPDGLPDDWQRLYFGSKSADWEGPNVDSDGDGASNWQEFLAGTNPRDPESVLKSRMTNTPQGRRLTWNTVAGCVYQIEATSDFINWAPTGSPRFATGPTDTMILPAAVGVAYYRVVRVQ